MSSRSQIAAVAADGTVGERPGDVRRVVESGGSFPAPLALNVVPWAGSLKVSGYTSEELKVRNESRKILGLPDLKVAATCVRVPVITTHSLAVHAVFEQEVDRAEAQDLLRQAESIVLLDNPENLDFQLRSMWSEPIRHTWVGSAGPSTTRSRSISLSAATTCARALH